MPHSPEQNPIPLEIKETREPKMDFDWEKHLKAKLTEGRYVKYLDNLVIEGPKGNIDILEKFDIKDVVIHNEKESGGGCSDTGIVILNKFDNLSDLALLMHELGHRQQLKEAYQNKKLKFIYDYRFGFKNLNQIEFLLEITRVFPETVHYLGEENVIELKKLKERKIDLFLTHRLSPAHDSFEDSYSPDIKFTAKEKAIKNELASIEQVQKNILKNLGDKLVDVEKLLTKIHERDATARALKWFREMSDETGINFLKKFKVEKPAESDSCQSSIQEGMSNPDKFEETDVVEVLNKFLGTYHADTLNKTYDPTGTGKRIKLKLKK